MGPSGRSRTPICPKLRTMFVENDIHQAIGDGDSFFKHVMGALRARDRLGCPRLEHLTLRLVHDSDEQYDELFTRYIDQLMGQVTAVDYIHLEYP